MSLPPIGMLDGKLEDTDPCKNYKRAKAWHAKKKTECSGRETTLECQKALDAANVDEIQRGQAAKGCSGGRRRRKTRRSRRRKTRGGDPTGYRDSNPLGSPDSPGARARAVSEAQAKRQKELADTASVGTRPPTGNYPSTVRRADASKRPSNPFGPQPEVVGCTGTSCIGGKSRRRKGRKSRRRITRRR